MDINETLRPVAAGMSRQADRIDDLIVEAAATMGDDFLKRTRAKIVAAAYAALSPHYRQMTAALGSIEGMTPSDLDAALDRFTSGMVHDVISVMEANLSGILSF